MRQGAPEAYKDPRVEALRREISAAARRGEKAETEQLSRRQGKLLADVRREHLQRMRDANDGSLDDVVAEQYLKLPDASGDDEPAAPTDFNAPPYRAMAARMGQLPLSGGRPADGADVFSARFGHASHKDAQLRLNWVSFEDASEGAPALLRWLAARGCTSMKYEFSAASEWED
jgi:hypothetical protein